MIIDAHCHVWPDHIAPQVLRTQPAGIEPVHDGTLSGLLQTMDASGIDVGVCLGVASTAKNVQRTNEWIGAIARDRLVPFGTVHPELTAEENLSSLRDNGIRGVKLHPLFQDLHLADPRVVEICTGLAEAGLPVITHVGAGGDPAANDRGAPVHAASLLMRVPSLTLVACHFGGYHRLDESQRHLVGTSAFLETSWPPTVGDLDRQRVREVIEQHGADRVVFGSDWPMADPAKEVAAVRALGLASTDEAAVLGENLASVLGLM